MTHDNAVCVIFCNKKNLILTLERLKKVMDWKNMENPPNVIIPVPITVKEVMLKFSFDSSKHPRVISIKPFNNAWLMDEFNLKILVMGESTNKIASTTFKSVNMSIIILKKAIKPPTTKMLVMELFMLSFSKFCWDWIFALLFVLLLDL